MRTAATAAAFLCLALCALPAAGQEDDSDEGFRIAVGAGIASRPSYPGSDDQRISAFPFVSLAYGRFFLGAEPGSSSGGGVGMHFYRSRGIRLGATLTADFRKPREESDDPSLQGMGDIERTVRAGLFASTTLGWLTLRASTASDIGGHDQGTLVRFDALGHYRATDKLTLSAGPGITWADGERAQTFFGVTAAQSAASGLPAYQAGSGVESVRFTLSARYAFDRRWAAGAFFSAGRLQGDAADSPITQSRVQNSAGLFASYRF